MSEQLSKEKNRTQIGFPVVSAVFQFSLQNLFLKGERKDVRCWNYKRLCNDIRYKRNYKNYHWNYWYFYIISCSNADYGPVTALDISNTQGSIYWVTIGYQVRFSSQNIESYSQGMLFFGNLKNTTLQQPKELLKRYKITQVALYQSSSYQIELVL